MTQTFPPFQHGVLSKEFVELMGHCNTIQAQYRERNVERIQRQLKISEYMKHNFDFLICSHLRFMVCGQCREISVLITSPPSAV